MKESSEVLARKYRPTNFDELIGQETVAQTLSLALDSNRLSHAYLFSGLRGSGKTSTARIFAKALICEKGVSHKPCGECQNCISALESRHIDIIEMDAASNRGIDDIKALVEQTKYKPNNARFKVIIIDEVHMLSTPAFNALLKTLEEPPSYVKFILATTDPLKLPATILSRTQHFRFKSIATNKIVDHLSYILNLEEIEFEKDALEILARSGSGSLRDTLTLLDQAIIYSKNHVDVRTVTDMLGLVDPKFIAELFNAIFAKDYALLVKYTKTLEDYEAEMVVDELIAYLKERMYAQDPVFSTLILDRFFRILSDSKYLFSINADGSFVLSLIFFKMVEALRIKEIDQMIESLQKEISRPQTSAVDIKLNTTEITTKQESKPTLSTPPKEQEEKTPSNEMFEKLKAGIKDRNYELGKCFEEAISFVSFNDGVLTWESCADEEAKKALKHGWGAISHLVKEVFGFNTKIKHKPCTKEIKPVTSAQPTQQNIEKDSTIQSASMVEDIEVGGSSSCVTSCLDDENKPKEIDRADIQKEPMVQKAIEMFEATKITIQSKV
ncbi:MAG: DNA polymerase III subunit gamma/tau [Epsilonproteobacteria bacterium]|nr:DNA polymerase III subunit gamma/tau [Campylobacterota bacterium]